MTTTSFSMTRDLGSDSIHHLQINPRSGESVVGDRPDDVVVLTDRREAPGPFD